MEGSRESVEGVEEEWEGCRARERSDGPSRALQQITALLKRNVIDRRRTKTTTFCELFSPILLLCVLVFGYSLSDVLVFPEEMYASVNLQLPGILVGLLPFAGGKSFEDLANRTLSSLSSASLPSDPGDSGEGRKERGDGMDFHDVRTVFRDMTDLLDGPFPVPSLDRFVGVGTAVANDLEDAAFGKILNRMDSGWTFGNIITQGTLHFAPAAEPAVGELVEWLSNNTNSFDALTHRIHESEDAAIAYALDHLEERTWAVVAVNEATTGRADYTIRMNFTVVPNTNTVVDVIAIGLDPSFRSYYLSGFLTLQTTIDRFMFERALPASPSDDRDGEHQHTDQDVGDFACVPPEVVGVPFPTAAYDQNLFYAAVGYLLGLAMTMSTMYPLSRLVKSIVEEKESRVRETMRIMGLHAWAHEVSWLLTGLATFSFIAVSVAALLSWTFLPLADGSLLLVFMLAFTLSEVGMAMAVASVFSKAKLASIAAPCVLFAGVLPRYIFYGSNRHEAPRSKMLASLLSPTAFTFGADFIADYEYADIGAGWDNYDEGGYSLQTSIAMMFLDALLYGLLAWYLDKIVPPEYGTARDPLKFLTSIPRAVFNRAAVAWRFFGGNGSGWTAVPTDSVDEGDVGVGSVQDVERRNGGGVQGCPEDFEAVDAGGGRNAADGVVISGLRKKFGSKVAVSGLDLRLRPGYITCLLGHNGAGKSTTISMLTGQLGATSGDALVWGHSLKDSLHKVRQDMGICPQHDALMPLLTAREHLELYMDIKGMRQNLKGPLVQKMLRDVGLLEKEHTQSMNLSGGQKRKLSVALALTGSPTLCILDEPTSGMDPYSRRFTWELLRRGRAGRCTLLSTHFMEEAEHLGDRIAMLRQGKLRCLGSPLFLKSRFGLGYKLTLVKAGESFDVENVGRLVLSHVPRAETLSTAGGEISFRLPREESGKFPGLFRNLESGREEMGIGGYGVSITSLEEVFLSIESEGRVEDDALIGRDSNADGGRTNAIVASGAGRPRNGDIRAGSRGRGSGVGTGLRRRQGTGRGAASASNGIASSDSWSEESRTPTQAREIEMQSMAASGVGRITEPLENGLRSGNVGKKAKKVGTGERIAFDDQDRAELLAEGQQDNETTAEAFCSIPLDSGEDIDGRGDSVSNFLGEARGVVGQNGAGLVEQLRWLLWKRRVIAMRDWRGGLYQVVLPALLVALVLVLLTIDVGLVGPSLAMSAAMFDGPTQVLYVQGGGERPDGETYAAVADATDWTRLHAGQDSELYAPTSSGLSQFLLDTYDAAVVDDTSAGSTVEGTRSRPPRYGAFVFGDLIPLNVTVDWDAVRERPELVAMVLETIADSLPTEGGEFDLKELLEAAGMDKNDVTRMIVENSARAKAAGPDSDGNVRRVLSPQGDDAFQGEPVGPEDIVNALGGTEAWGKTNWTEQWLELVDEDPTVRFTHIEYVADTSELKLQGVEVVLHFQGRSDTILNKGEVTISVNDVVRAMPPGTVSYDRSALPFDGNYTTVMFNTTAPHALPAWVGELTAKTFEACAVRRGVEQGQASFITRNHPLPLTATESLEVQTVLSLLVSLLVTIPLCYAPAAFVTFLVRERACKSKRVQLVSGASPLAYWVSAYLWDSLLFFVLTVLVMLAFAGYGRDASKVFMMHSDALVGTWGLLVSYGLSALPLSYLYSFAFDGPSSAQISIAGMNFVSGFGFVIAYAVLSSLKKTARFAGKAQSVFRLFPPYLLGDGLLKVSSEFYIREVLGRQRPWGVLAWDVAGQAIVYMCLQAVGYLALVLLVEYSLAAGVRAKVDRFRLRLGGWTDQDLGDVIASSTDADEDRDVKAERLRVDQAMGRLGRSRAPPGNGDQDSTAETETGMDTVLIRGLAKVYPAPMSSAQQPPKCAVRGLSLGVKRGECFGLLGINGAGKSTTLQILTRDLQATSGSLKVEGKSITSGAVCRLLGYCPQTDPLLPLMTVNETLLLYGGLKGVGSENLGDNARNCRRFRWRGSGRDDALQKAASSALKAVSLGPTENQLAGTLSGGNKRKLSLAVALIGEPPVLLLDEPSSGMDPGARRSMWEVISSLSASRSVILTTHSMEECEAVCDRLGIMVGGRLRCLGTSQHLKGRFGGGYSIEVRCPTTSMPRVVDMIGRLSPLARLEEMHPTLAKFSIPAGGGDREGFSESYGTAGGEGNGDREDARSSQVELSLSAAFETIEARKEELEVWDYSINQATLETIFMSFAKHQEEETANVPGLNYTGSIDLDQEADQAIPRRDPRAASRRGDQHSTPSPAMDVEMGFRGRGRS